MDVIIPDNWLRDFIKTEAKPAEIARYTSLCGPSVEKVEKKNNDYIYFIEITTNRVDAAGIYGFAKEVAAILPRFGINAKLLQPEIKSKEKFAQKVDYLTAKVDFSLCYRFTTILIKDVQIGKSPDWFEKRIKGVGLRPINNVVDISNYVMHELGQPIHTFDYDKIKKSTMILRQSKKGEKLITLDNKSHNLPGGDIVIEDGAGRLIDLCGIMGGQNSCVDEKTKNVLLFVQTYNPFHIRRTSMTLAQRSEAASLFEKGLDTELVTLTIKRCLDLFVELTKGKPEKYILDLYPKPYRKRVIKTDQEFIEKRLGIKINKNEVSKILKSLAFTTIWHGNNLVVSIPSSRANDVSIPEDIVEEIARIYGYHNLPSKLMSGELPQTPAGSPFKFEKNLKNLIKELGGKEIYTLSLVPKSFTDKNSLCLKNPLGKKTKYLRTNLRSSLIEACKLNSSEKNPFHLFEIANVYLPQKDQLPDEKMMLAGILANYNYRDAKGVIESLLKNLNIDYSFEEVDDKYYKPTQRLKIISGKNYLGQYGVLDNDYLYYEFEVEKQRFLYKPFRKYKASPKYPAQIEDITLSLPQRTKVGEVIKAMKITSNLVSNVELTDIFQDFYTFRIWYQDPKRTLTDKEVEKIREKILSEIKKKFGASLKN